MMEIIKFLMRVGMFRFFLIVLLILDLMGFGVLKLFYY